MIVCVGCGLCMYSVLLGSVDVWLAGVGTGVTQSGILLGFQQLWV